MVSRTQNMYKYISITLFFLFFLFIGIIFFIFYLNHNILDYFNIFDDGSTIINYIKNTIENNITTNYYRLGIIFVTYSILLGYMKSKSIYTYKKENNNLHFNIFLQIYKMFNFIIIPILFIYLFMQNQYIDLIVISFAFIFTKKIFIPFQKSYLLLLVSYKDLELLDGRNIQKTLEILKKSIKTLSFKFKKKTKKEHHNNDSIRGLIIRFLLPNLHHYEKILISLTIIIPLIFSYLNLNLITITYILLTLIFWTHIIFIIENGFPQKINIKLNDGNMVEEVYIIEDDSISMNILNKNDEIYKINKNNISEIKLRS